MTSTDSTVFYSDLVLHFQHQTKGKDRAVLYVSGDALRVVDEITKVRMCLLQDTPTEHSLLVFERLFILHLVIAGFDRGSDDWEGVVLCSRSKQWEGFCLHLSRRHHSSLDVSRISCCQGIRKCLTCFLIQYACRATFVCVVRTCMYVFTKFYSYTWLCIATVFPLLQQNYSHYVFFQLQFCKIIGLSNLTV